MVTMSQKSSFLQPANSVSQVLIPDKHHRRRFWTPVDPQRKFRVLRFSSALIFVFVFRSSLVGARGFEPPTPSLPD